MYYISFTSGYIVKYSLYYGTLCYQTILHHVVRILLIHAMIDYVVLCYGLSGHIAQCSALMYYIILHGSISYSI